MSTKEHLKGQSFRRTLWGALLLRVGLYDNARNTPSARRIALAIVLLSALSRMLGSAVIMVISRAAPWVFGLTLVLQGLAVIVGYYFWAFTIFKIGRWLRPSSPTTYGDLLSSIGFAHAPQVLGFLTLIPLLGRPIEIVLGVWSLLAVIIAVREGLDIRTRWATLICLVGWPLIQIAVGFVQEFGQSISNP